MNSTGERITFIRTKIFNMNQVQFAEFIGVKGKSAVSNWENNLAYPEIKYLIKISEESGKSIDWILKGENKDSPSIAKEPPESYKLKELEKEKQELEAENTRLRSFIDGASELLHQADLKRGKRGKR